MKTIVTESDFRDAFHRMDRGEQFSYTGLGVLFAYLQEYESDTGEEIELDVIALCCDYAEDTWEGIAEAYAIDISDCEDEDDIEDTVREYLSFRTHLAGEVPGGCVYFQF